MAHPLFVPSRREELPPHFAPPNLPFSFFPQKVKMRMSFPSHHFFFPFFLILLKIAANFCWASSTFVDGHCDADTEKAIGQCLDPMLAFANAIQLADAADGHRHFSLQGPQVFHRLCALYADFKECTSSFAECRSLSIQAVEASYGFMCGNGQDEFREFADCFARVENRPDYIQCRSEAAEAMDKVAAGNEGEGHRGELCRAMADYLGCCRPLVEKSCGQRAWELVARVSAGLRVSLPKCQLAVLIDHPSEH